MSEPNARLAAIAERVLASSTELAEAERLRILSEVTRLDAAAAGELEVLLQGHEELAVLRGLFAAGRSFDADAPDLAGSDLHAGSQLGNYRIVGRLGSGGMGTVYLAEQQVAGVSRRVALKVLNGFVGSRRAYERFQRERAILSRFSHPNIAQMYDAGQTGEREPYLVMELVEGQPITTFCEANVPTIAGRLDLLLAVAAALAYAHRNLVVHRDIKPNNILVRPDGVVKLLDFGIAKLLDDEPGEALTRSSFGPMTPEYAAPEQFRNEPITVATDIYQFGVLAYRVICGRSPYRGEQGSLADWIDATARDPLSFEQQLATTPSATRLPRGVLGAYRPIARDLGAILRKAMAKDGALRYASMDALVGDLRAVLENRPVSAARSSALASARRAVARRPYLFAGTGAAVVALLATTLLATGQALRARHASARANEQAAVAKREAERANATNQFLVDLFRVSDPGFNRGDRLNANEILERGARTIDQRFGSDPDLRASLLTTIGEVYSAMGDYRRAQEPLAAAAALRRTPSAENGVELGRTLRSLAYVEVVYADYAKALEVIEEAERALADRHDAKSTELLAEVVSRHGLVLNLLGRFDEAGAAYRRALDLLESLAQPSGETAAIVRGNYGSFLNATGRVDAALDQYRVALLQGNRALGADHYLMLRIAVNAGMTLNGLARFDESDALLLETAERIRRVVGAGNNEYASALLLLGQNALARGDSARAIDFYSRSIAAFHAAVGEQSMALGFPQLGIGRSLHLEGDYAGALYRLDEALQTFARKLPADHQNIAIVQVSRAETLLALGRGYEARLLAENALATVERRLGADHADTIDTLRRTGIVRSGSGDYAGALSAWDQCLERSARAFGPMSPRYLTVRASIDADRLRDGADGRRPLPARSRFAALPGLGAAL